MVSNNQAFSCTSSPCIGQHCECCNQQNKGNVPLSFFCPLTLNVMKDPVVDSDGNSYERSAISKWLETYKTSPVTRKPLYQRQLVPNRALRDVISEYMGPDLCKDADREPKHSQTEYQNDLTFQKGLPASNHTCCRDTVARFLYELSRSIGKDIRLAENETDPTKKSRVLEKALELTTRNTRWMPGLGQGN